MGRLVITLYRSLLRWVRNPAHKHAKFVIHRQNFPELASVWPTFHVRNAEGVKQAISEGFRSTRNIGQPASVGIAHAVQLNRYLAQYSKHLQEVAAAREKNAVRPPGLLYEVGQVVRHKKEQWRGVVMRWEADTEGEPAGADSVYTYIVLPDQQDAMLYLGGQFAQRLQHQGQLEPVGPLRTRRIKSQWIPYQFQGMNAAGTHFVPREDLAYLYPADTAWQRSGDAAEGEEDMDPRFTDQQLVDLSEGVAADIGALAAGIWRGLKERSIGMGEPKLTAGGGLDSDEVMIQKVLQELRTIVTEYHKDGPQVCGDAGSLGEPAKAELPSPWARGYRAVERYMNLLDSVERRVLLRRQQWRSAGGTSPKYHVGQVLAAKDDDDPDSGFCVVTGWERGVKDGPLPGPGTKYTVLQEEDQLDQRTHNMHYPSLVACSYLEDQLQPLSSSHIASEVICKSAYFSSFDPIQRRYTPSADLRFQYPDPTYYQGLALRHLRGEMERHTVMNNVLVAVLRDMHRAPPRLAPLMLLLRHARSGPDSDIAERMINSCYLAEVRPAVLHSLEKAQPARRERAPASAHRNKEGAGVQPLAAGAGTRSPQPPLRSGGPGRGHGTSLKAGAAGEQAESSEGQKPLPKGGPARGTGRTPPRPSRRVRRRPQEGEAEGDGGAAKASPPTPAQVDQLSGQARLDLAAAAVAAQNRDYRAALHRLTLLLQLYPGLRVARLQRAEVHLSYGQPEKAIQDTALVLASDPENFGAWTTQGRAHMRLGQHRAAVKCLSEALRLHPWGTVSRDLVRASRAADLLEERDRAAEQEAAVPAAADKPQRPEQVMHSAHEQDGSALMAAQPGSGA